MILTRRMKRFGFAVTWSILASAPGNAQRTAPLRFAPHQAPLLTLSAHPESIQIRVAQPRRAGPVRRGIIMGAVIGGGLMITWLILEDMLGGELLVKDNAKDGLSPGRILTYTGIGVGVGAVVGGTIGYIYQRRGERAGQARSSTRHAAAEVRRGGS
jgi:hypothetical protein